MAGSSRTYEIGRQAGRRWMQRFLEFWTHTRLSCAGRIPGR